ncbi:aldo/keto reductase [Congregibacter sp.]|jgi:aryl-alcohol dehydrogenase-like predicted oxidoreductase|uniref:aldo/keto reductase n=1 Tax=Congregibacter sp. TaxID=2744308 RepID=UPI0039E3427A
MNYRKLGRSGLKVSSIALGTDNFANPTPEAEVQRIIDRALEAGINLVDTSDSYAGGECEAIIGRALKKNGRRDSVVLATKVHYPTGSGPNASGNSRLHIMSACEASLQRLGVDHIDLYQLHRPSPDIPIDETLRALTDLVRQGKVRYIGCSTHPAWKVMEALMTSELKGLERFVCEQPPYNLLDRRIENELVPLCEEYGLGLIPWSPMAMGMLAGRYADAGTAPADSRATLRGGIYAERVTARGVEIGNRFVDLAKQHGIPPAQLAVLWVKDQPGITAPLIGPRTVAQLEQLLPVTEMSLSDDLRKACDELNPPGTVITDFHNSAPWMKTRVAG